MVLWNIRVLFARFQGGMAAHVVFQFENQCTILVPEETACLSIIGESRFATIDAKDVNVIQLCSQCISHIYPSWSLNEVILTS